MEHGVDELLTVTGSVVGTQQLQQLCRLSRHFTNENLTVVLQVLLSLQQDNIIKQNLDHVDQSQFN